MIVWDTCINCVFFPCHDPEPCSLWEMTLSTAELANSIAEEDITFAKTCFMGLLPFLSLQVFIALTFHYG